MRRLFCFFFSSRRRHTRFDCDWSSDVCSSDLVRADTPSAIPDPNGDETELACRHQNIFLVACPNGTFEMDCTVGCPQCAPSCPTVRAQCDAACTATCTNTHVGNC